MMIVQIEIWNDGKWSDKGERVNYESSLREDAKEAKTWEPIDEEEETLKYFNQAFNDPYLEECQLFSVWIWTMTFQFHLLRENTFLKVEGDKGGHRVDEEQLLDVGVRHKVLLPWQQVKILATTRIGVCQTWSS